MKTQMPLTVDQTKITIHFGSQRDGYTFRLRPKSMILIKDQYPNRQRVDSVFIGFDQRQNLHQMNESIWTHISQMLTGLSIEELTTLGGFTVTNPVTSEEAYNSLLIHA